MHATTRAAVAGGLSAFLLGGTAAAAFAAPTPTVVPTAGPKDKVYVCKFVGKPGVDERLQTGQNPIEVSVNAIPVKPVTIGSKFADRQSHSVVVGIVGVTTPAPTADACKALITPMPTATPTTPAPTTPAPRTAKPTTPGPTTSKPTTPAPTATPTRGVPAKTGAEDDLPVAPLAVLGVLAVAGGSMVALKRRR